MIKAVIFDLGGVLFTNGTREFISKLSSKKHIDPKIVKDVIDGELGSKYRTGKITRDEFWNEAKKTLNINEATDELERQWIDEYKLIEGTKNLLDQLSRKYKVYYLSDNVRERINKIDQKYNFLKWFDGGVFSHEVGVRKPDPKIYEIVLSKAAVLASEALLIDDKLTSLPPAEELGMRTILFTNPEALRGKLTEMGIL